MAELLIEGRFDQAPEVVGVGDRAIGLWVRLASYHARWPDDDIHWSLPKMYSARKADMAKLLDAGWLVEAPDGYRLGFSGSGLWRISRSGPFRPQIARDVRAAVFARDGSACLFCDATDDLTLDHIIPWSHGGPDTVDNLRVLCRRCNSSRGNRVEVGSG